MILMLGNSELTKKIFHEIPKEEWDEIESVQKIINENVWNVISDKELIESDIIKKEKSDYKFNEILNIPDAVATIPFLFGNPPSLNPVSRIIVFSKNKKIVMDASLDTGEILFLAESLLSAVINQFENNKKLAIDGQIKIDHKERVGESITKIERIVGQIKAIAGQYEIKLKE
jgi:Fe-S cluster biosynthesis and repair protein YggX